MDQPKTFRLERVPGGRLPDVGALLSATLAEFSANLGPYAMAGIGPFIAGMVLMMVLFPVIYVGLTVVMFGGIFASALVGAGVAGVSGSDDAGALAMIVSYFASFGLMFGAIFALAAVMGTVTAPMNASLARAVAAHQRGEGKLEVGSAFSTATQDLPSVLFVAALYLTAIALAAMACYVPAFFVMVVASMAPTMVHLHRVGGMTAMTSSMRHAMGNLGFYVPFAGILFVIGMVAAYIPVIGPMFGVALHVRAYREMFGDGEEPVGV